MQGDIVTAAKWLAAGLIAAAQQDARRETEKNQYRYPPTYFTRR